MWRFINDYESQINFLTSTFRRKKLWKMCKDILVWSPNAFERLESRLNYMPALPSKIKLWEHKVIFYCYALYTSMVCSGECTFHHITACGGTTLCSNVASPGILIYAASCFYHPASWSPWEVGGLGLWLHTEPLVPVLVSSCWHISLWVAESRLGNDKW